MAQWWRESLERWLGKHAHEIRTTTTKSNKQVSFFFSFLLLTFSISGYKKKKKKKFCFLTVLIGSSFSRCSSDGLPLLEVSLSGVDPRQQLAKSLHADIKLLFVLEKSLAPAPDCGPGLLVLLGMGAFQSFQEILQLLLWGRVGMLADVLPGTNKNRKRRKKTMKPL